MAAYGKKASDKVEEAMHERKQGTLKSGRSGKKVTSKKQAIAIGLSEARKEGGKVPAKRAGKKTTAKKSSAKKAIPRKTGTKKTAAKKATAKKTTARKTAAKKAPARKAAKKSAAKRSS